MALDEVMPFLDIFHFAFVSQEDLENHIFLKYGRKWLNKNVAVSLSRANPTGSGNHQRALERILPLIWTKHSW